MWLLTIWLLTWLLAWQQVMGRGALQRFKMKCGCCGVDMARDVKVLDTNSCHNTRSCLWHPHYYLYGERLCDEPLRPGETSGEFCVPGRADEEGGQKGCAMLNHKVPRDVALEWAPWTAAHYAPYDRPMELAPCMEGTVSGWGCPAKGPPPPGDGGGGASSSTAAAGGAAGAPPEEKSAEQLAWAKRKQAYKAAADAAAREKEAAAAASAAMDAAEEGARAQARAEARAAGAAAAAAAAREAVVSAAAASARAGGHGGAGAGARAEAGAGAGAASAAAGAAEAGAAAEKAALRDAELRANAARAKAGEAMPTAVEGVTRRCNPMTGKCFLVRTDGT